MRGYLRSSSAGTPWACASLTAGSFGGDDGAGLTAYQMGHTETKMVIRVYAVPAKMAGWGKWWAI
jgi:hypothetical protein